MHTKQLALRSLYRRSKRKRFKCIDDSVPELPGVVCDFVKNLVEEAVPRTYFRIFVISS